MTCICTASVKHLRSTTQDHHHDRPITVQISAPLKSWVAKITSHQNNRCGVGVQLSTTSELTNECKVHSLHTPLGMPADKPPSWTTNNLLWQAEITAQARHSLGPMQNAGPTDNSTMHKWLSSPTNHKEPQGQLALHRIKPRAARQRLAAREGSTTASKKLPWGYTLIKLEKPRPTINLHYSNICSCE